MKYQIGERVRFNSGMWVVVRREQCSVVSLQDSGIRCYKAEPTRYTIAPVFGQWASITVDEGELNLMSDKPEQVTPLVVERGEV